ncbi:hypothetical protein FQA47_003925 [Oryzias melastigma]|uniref:Uncharacterized protein n=1 Tax=Oryzias melastigma TaxID=30732 RepID=A0A834C5A4_ORYME|nr:hypothetical protein FQA47_003925 [Oryzias melastigma]
MGGSPEEEQRGVLIPKSSIPATHQPTQSGRDPVLGPGRRPRAEAAFPDRNAVHGPKRRPQAEAASPHRDNDDDEDGENRNKQKHVEEDGGGAALRRFQQALSQRNPSRTS